MQGYDFGFTILDYSCGGLAFSGVRRNCLDRFALLRGLVGAASLFLLKDEQGGEERELRSYSLRFVLANIHFIS